MALSGCGRQTNITHSLKNYSLVRSYSNSEQLDTRKYLILCLVSLLFTEHRTEYLPSLLGAVAVPAGLR